MKQLGQPNSKRVGQRNDRGEARHAHPAFDALEKPKVNFCKLGELLLRDAGTHPERVDVRAHARQDQPHPFPRRRHRPQETAERR